MKPVSREETIAACPELQRVASLELEFLREDRVECCPSKGVVLDESIVDGENTRSALVVRDDEGCMGPRGDAAVHQRTTIEVGDRLHETEVVLDPEVGVVGLVIASPFALDVEG